ncbi:MEDS domain-containing protein [Nitrosomonas sp. Nm166]|uniref:MEDS domain-containing protein n=1 Tax=Nitrosomonas sp. Nm166 TaxID=1881054 RepID=UPI0008E6B474|nr:MEDS domain-containing protein [Nitrosomonas sp. Nm166]SFD97074.1 MEDS: MEthanogen/methylotroph, DcmR Sensory domain [Nitrosomonas sp. Nm166]
MKLSSLETVSFNSAAGSHIVQICQNEISQVEILTQYIQEGLLNDEAVIVIAKTALRKAVLSKLDTLGFNMQALKNKDQVKFFDAEFLLSDLLLNGVLEEEAFQKFVALPVQAAKLKYGKVRAFGEMVDVLWQNGRHDSAVQLEGLWSDLCKKEELNLLCTYLLTSLDPNSYDQSLEHICKCHTHLVPMSRSFNPKVGEAMLIMFWAAWNRVVAKLAKSHQIIRQIST